MYLQSEWHERSHLALPDQYLVLVLLVLVFENAPSFRRLQRFYEDAFSAKLASSVLKWALTNSGTIRAGRTLLRTL